MGVRAGWGLAGLIAGALLSAVLLRAVESGRATLASGGGGSTTAESSGSSAAGAEAERLRAEIATARQETETLRTENAALRRKVEDISKSGATSGSAASSPAKTWREIAAKLAKVREKVRGKKWDDWPDDCKDLQLEMFAAVTELSRRLGMPFEEALMSPDGLTKLLLEVLAQSDPPPSPGELARLEALREGGAEAWKAYRASRDDLSKLEQRVARGEAMQKTMGAMLAGLTPEQAAIARAYEMFEVHDDGGPSTWIEGSREKVTKELTGKWTEVLNLDPIQERAIGPIVDEFMAKAQEINNAVWKRKQAGEEISWSEQYKGQVALMIETQKKLAETARLTEEQAKAMKGWGDVYGVNVFEPPPAGK
ncbi:MAG: hypothetical protein AAB074_13355 [Planctomycetota bacterium]